MSTTFKTFAAGEMIFKEGDPSDCVYLVRSGDIAIVRENADGHQMILARLGESQVFGEMGAVESLPRSATALAMETTEVEIVPKNEFVTVIRKDPEAAFRVLQMLSMRLRAADNTISKQNDEIQKLSRENNFLETRLREGRKGAVHTELLQ